MKLALVFLVALLVVPALGVIPEFSVVQAQAKQAKKDLYSCPMHPDVTSTKPGRKCPKCGMTLVKKDSKPEAEAEAEPAPAAVVPEPTVEPLAAGFSSTKIPDAPVLDQNGRQFNFYSDLIKGRIVAINFIFTTCTTICPPLSATFRRVQQSAAERGLDVQLISVSVDPTTDTPERLHDYAAKFKADPGWVFVTGDKAKIDSVLSALGAAVANKNDHTPMILIGNDKTNYWTRAYGLTSPTKIVDLLVGAAEHK